MKSGFIIIDKPGGISSYDVIRHIKRLFPRGTKIGHAGTLDPLATGMLIVGMGREATRELGALAKKDKVYETTLHLGKRYDTLDVTGRLLEERDPSSVTKEDFIQVLKSFIGEIEQIPPMYSACKFKGQPLYKLARKGVEVTRTPRKVVIHDAVMLYWKPPFVSIKVTCSSGTYIRTLVDDMGKILSVGAAVSEIRRTRIGDYSIKDAIPLKSIINKNDIEERLFQVQRKNLDNS